MKFSWPVATPFVLAALMLALSGQARADSNADSTAGTGRAKSTPADGEARHERAKRLYEEAARAYSERRNFEAIELFRQSAALEPSALLSYNIALAYEEAGDTKNALKYFREYLGAAPDAEDAESVRSTIDELEQRLAKLGVQQLTVVSEPSGATVTVDGVAVGVTPFTGEFAPGTHEIVLSHARHATTRASVELPSDRSIRVALELEPSAEQVAPQATPVAPRDAESSLSRVEPLTWGLLGVGAGSVMAGVLFELSSASSEREAEAATSPVDGAEARGAAHSKHTAALTLLGAGGAFLVTGGVLAAIELTRTEPGVAVARSRAEVAARGTQVDCSPAFCGIHFSGNF